MPGAAESDEFGAFGVPAHVIQKNSREQIRVGLNEFKGHEYLDIRSFYPKDGGWMPSSKGITLPRDKFGELFTGVVELGRLLGIEGFDAETSDTTP